MSGSGEFLRADQVLLETIKDHPTGDAYNALGDCHARAVTQNAPSQRSKLRMRLTVRIGNPTITRLALLTKGDRSRAASEYKLRFDSNPISASHFALATLLQEEGRLDRSRKGFEAVLQFDPKLRLGTEPGDLIQSQGKDA